MEITNSVLQAIYKGEEMAQMKAIQLEYQEMLDQLTASQKNDILMFMLMDLNMWSKNEDVLERIKGHSAMLLEMLIYNINKKIAINNIGEEQ